ncbi:MAG TPA: hypothetical protein VFN35_27775, partial [Ktedonobacteraceae bacterium]|nr:hypothetical protein [Ktedonobacteraceae bacterium]
ERHSESFVIEMTDFIQAVLSDTPVPVSGIDGRIPVVMGLAAQRSLLEHRPVRLSEIDTQNTRSEQ